ncbi:MAG: hypothetical protein AMXMBFR26_22250 [Porticoccaceae bacterium]
MKRVSRTAKAVPGVTSWFVDYATGQLWRGPAVDGFEVSSCAGVVFDERPLDAAGQPIKAPGKDGELLIGLPDGRFLDRFGGHVAGDMDELLEFAEARHRWRRRKTVRDVHRAT